MPAKARAVLARAGAITVEDRPQTVARGNNWRKGRSRHSLLPPDHPQKRPRALSKKASTATHTRSDHTHKHCNAHTHTVITRPPTLHTGTSWAALCGLSAESAGMKAFHGAWGVSTSSAPPSGPNPRGPGWRAYGDCGIAVAKVLLRCCYGVATC